MVWNRGLSSTERTRLVRDYLGSKWGINADALLQSLPTPLVTNASPYPDSSSLIEQGRSISAPMTTWISGSMYLWDDPVTRGSQTANHWLTWVGARVGVNNSMLGPVPSQGLTLSSASTPLANIPVHNRTFTYVFQLPPGCTGCVCPLLASHQHGQRPSLRLQHTERTRGPLPSVAQRLLVGHAAHTGDGCHHDVEPSGVGGTCCDGSGHHPRANILWPPNPLSMKERCSLPHGLHGDGVLSLAPKQRIGECILEQCGDVDRPRHDHGRYVSGHIRLGSWPWGWVSLEHLTRPSDDRARFHPLRWTSMSPSTACSRRRE